MMYILLVLISCFSLSLDAADSHKRKRVNSDDEGELLAISGDESQFSQEIKRSTKKLRRALLSEGPRKAVYDDELGLVRSRKKGRMSFKDTNGWGAIASDDEVETRPSKKRRRVGFSSSPLPNVPRMMNEAEEAAFFEQLRAYSRPMEGSPHTPPSEPLSSPRTPRVGEYSY